jgi:hypothetical protein
LHKNAQSVAGKFPRFRIILQKYRGKADHEFPYRTDKKEFRSRDAAVPQKGRGSGGGFGGERPGPQKKYIRMRESAVK